MSNIEITQTENPEVPAVPATTVTTIVTPAEPSAAPEPVTVTAPAADTK